MRTPRRKPHLDCAEFGRWASGDQCGMRGYRDLPDRPRDTRDTRDARDARDARDGALLSTEKYGNHSVLILKIT